MPTLPTPGIKLMRGIERLQELRYDRCRGLTLSRNRLRRRARNERQRYDGLTQQHPFHRCLTGETGKLLKGICFLTLRSSFGSSNV